MSSRSVEATKLRRHLLRGTVVVFVTAGYSGKRFIFEKVPHHLSCLRRFLALHSWQGCSHMLSPYAAPTACSAACKPDIWTCACNLLRTATRGAGKGAGRACCHPGRP